VFEIEKTLKASAVDERVGQVEIAMDQGGRSSEK
jgi:hypothetical protein